MVNDAVIGIISRDSLPNVLTLIHRSGLGPQARVLDPERGDISAQLARAGVIDPPPFDVDVTAEMVLLVFSAGRMVLASEAMAKFGGREICVLGRRTSFLVAPPQKPITARRGMRKPNRPSAPPTPIYSDR
ncbi:hypothetical protein BH09CHL1_BH09CHL1_33200 [soil metagenome]